MKQSKKVQISNRRKAKIIQNWLSSFVVTAAVLVAAAVLIPKTPSATIVQLVTVGTDIFYEVEVLAEEDNGESSLKILAESNLHNAQQPLHAGMTSGQFSALRPNTEYTLSVVGNSGFGNYLLTKQTVKTGADYEGKFLQAEIITQEWDYEQTFACDYTVAVSDLKNQFSEVYVSGFYSMGEEIITLEPQTIQSAYSTNHIEYLPRMNGILTLQLSAVLVNGESVLLDEIQVTSPFVVQAYFYLEYSAETSASFAVYPDETLENAVYFIKLFKEEDVIEQKEAVMEIMQESYTMGFVTFENLLPQIEYSAELYITFLNPVSNTTETTLLQTVIVYVGMEVN